jgi:hypothetical protein
MRRVAVALLHHPVLDRGGEIVTTAITNLDLHDIARSAHTFALERFYVAHPIAAQRELAQRVREHWVNGSGRRRIPDRAPPMRGLFIVDSLDAAKRDFGGDGVAELWATSASAGEGALDHERAAARLGEPGPPVLLLFGTGWGLAPEVVARSDQRLAPIASPRPDGYNHLSVRAAAAILFDRLLNRAPAR